MIQRAISHLIPGVQPMAVGAQQPQIPLVRFPVAEAIVPDAGSTLVPQFASRIDVVDVQHPIVADTALDALPAEVGDDLQLPRPVARSLVLPVAVLGPVLRAAGVAAKAHIARLSALLAPAALFPSGGKVARLIAVFSGAVLQPVGVHLFRRSTVQALDRDGLLSHSQSISSQRHLFNFDIACRRIEDAQRQGSLFGAAA